MRYDNVSGKVDFNEKFLDFALYYGFLPVTCDVNAPYQKGKIERAIEYIRSSFFTGEKFESIEELNPKALNWCINIVQDVVEK